MKTLSCATTTDAEETLAIKTLAVKTLTTSTTSTQAIIDGFNRAQAATLNGKVADYVVAAADITRNVQVGRCG